MTFAAAGRRQPGVAAGDSPDVLFAAAGRRQPGVAAGDSPDAEGEGLRRPGLPVHLVEQTVRAHRMNRRRRQRRTERKRQATKIVATTGS